MASAGLELLFSSVQSQLRCASDAAVCYIHWEMITNGFSCIGVGENVPTNLDNVNRSELLPSGWNDSDEMYTLLYWPTSSQDTHLLKVIRMEDTLLIHLMRLTDQKMSNIDMNVPDYIGDNFKEGHRALKNTVELQKIIRKELIKGLDTLGSNDNNSKKDKESPKQPKQPRSPQRDEDDPLRDPLRVPGTGGRPRHPAPDWNDPGDPFALGRRDLDPLARGGGGMLMDPFRHGPRMPGSGFDPSTGLPSRLPPGAVPPGARFDPFGPGSTGGGGGRRPGPDPDFAMPPGYDDMFS